MIYTIQSKQTHDSYGQNHNYWASTGLISTTLRKYEYISVRKGLCTLWEYSICRLHKLLLYIILSSFNNFNNKSKYSLKWIPYNKSLEGWYQHFTASTSNRWKPWLSRVSSISYPDLWLIRFTVWKLCIQLTMSQMLCSEWLLS